VNIVLTTTVHSMFFYPASNIKNEKLSCKKFTLLFSVSKFIYIFDAPIFE
jgi:hypothetical protein